MKQSQKNSKDVTKAIGQRPKDMALVQAIPVDFSKILIDSTMQRPVNMRHVLKILNYFSQTMVMPIQVYKEGDNYIAWDGQHTSIAIPSNPTKYLVNDKQAQ